MGRALLAVGTALVLCFAVLGTVVYLTRDEDGVAVDAILAESITRALNDADLRRGSFGLSTLTPFQWDTVLVFAPDTPRASVSRALGFPWQGQLEFTAQSRLIFAFVRDGQLARFADYRGVGRFAGLREPFDRFTPDTAVFVVRDSVARPAGR